MSKSNYPALTAVLFAKLTKAGVEKLHLHWSGGSDESYLNIDTEPGTAQDLYTEIEEWAYDAFEYSGAGDGTDYGDDYTYDLIKKTVEHSEWCEVRQDGGTDSGKFNVEGVLPEEDKKLQRLQEAAKKAADAVRQYLDSKK